MAKNKLVCLILGKITTSTKGGTDRQKNYLKDGLLYSKIIWIWNATASTQNGRIQYEPVLILLERENCSIAEQN